MKGLNLSSAYKSAKFIAASAIMHQLFLNIEGKCSEYEEPENIIGENNEDADQNKKTNLESIQILEMKLLEKCI